MTERIKRYAKDKAGFSFMELMVVIALIGVLSAIALPSLLGNLPEKRLKNAARNLYADMQRARLQAVKENKKISVRFDTSTDGDFYYFDIDDSTNFTIGEFRRNLYEYGDVRYGCNASTDWNGNAVPSSGVTEDGSLVFSQTGMAYLYEDSEYADEIIVYLGSDDVNACYAVGVTHFGAVKIKWQRGGSSSWD
ncbi:GspH/FimT family pseudopilin [Desulfobulbus sp. F5]|nr:GspH/FimT family pseudopilin [Desulfobulbus sp. F5]